MSFFESVEGTILLISFYAFPAAAFLIWVSKVLNRKIKNHHLYQTAMWAIIGGVMITGVVVCSLLMPTHALDSVTCKGGWCNDRPVPGQEE